MISLTCGIKNMIQMKLSLKQKLTHRHECRLVFAKGGDGGGCAQPEMGVYFQKLRHKWNCNPLCVNAPQ